MTGAIVTRFRIMGPYCFIKHVISINFIIWKRLNNLHRDISIEIFQIITT